MHKEGFSEETQHGDPLHSDSVPELSFWWQTRAAERAEYGENVTFGPGYGQCVEQYYESDLGSGVPNNQLLDVAAEKMDLPRNRIVPVIAGSCQIGEYLAGVVVPERVLPLSHDLDMVVCATPEDALRLRGYSPILLPLSATKRVLLSLECVRQPEERRGNRIGEGREKRDQMRAEFARQFKIPEEKLALHLGSDEIIKASLRGIAALRGDKEKSTLFLPIPNYFDTIHFAERFGFSILPDASPNEYENHDTMVESWATSIARACPEAVYLSNPNNPLGYTLTLEDLRLLLRATPATARFMLDEVNINREAGGQIFSSPWQQLGKEFPDHHIIVIDSLSKSHDLVTERLGFGLATHEDDVDMLRKLEPPLFPDASFFRAGHALLSEPIENQTMLKIRFFYERLQGIQKKADRKISVGPTNSNFCIVEIHDPKIRSIFFKKLQSLDAGTIPAKRIVGLPLTGSGPFTLDDLEADGTIKHSALNRQGIVGLSQRAIRLSALNHPVVLDALENATLSVAD